MFETFEDAFRALRSVAAPVRIVSSARFRAGNLRAVAAPLLMLCFAQPSSADTTDVHQVNLTFVPEEVTIEAGDTIRWIWAVAAHTVTNGVSLSDPALGDLFDEPLNSLHQTLTLTFNSPGDIPYLCRPHFNLEMIGVIHVMPPTAAEERPYRESSWGRVKQLYR